MKKKYNLFWRSILALLLFVGVSCSEKDTPVNPDPIGPLTITVTVSPDNHLKVIVTARADNAITYKVFWEASDTTGQALTTTANSHIYDAVGTYAIKVEAFTTTVYDSATYEIILTDPNN